MKIEIIFDEKNCVYKWSLSDGPEEIDLFRGTEKSLGECMESIIMHRTLNAVTYSDDDKEFVFDVIKTI